MSHDSHVTLSHRCTPLHYAAAYNFLDFIEDFMELGAVVDVEDSKGNLTLSGTTSPDPPP